MKSSRVIRFGMRSSEVKWRNVGSAATAAMPRRKILPCRCARFSRPPPASIVSARCFREIEGSAFSFEHQHTLFLSEISSSLRSPNKPPEPTRLRTPRFRTAGLRSTSNRRSKATFRPFGARGSSLTLGIACDSREQNHQGFGRHAANVCSDQEAVRLGIAALSKRTLVFLGPRASLVSVSKVGDNLPLLPQRREAASSRFSPSVIFCSEIFHVCVAPNKALEPTSGTVTRRAAARRAPFPPEAHL
jgi:hypothetical protein